MTVCLSKDKFRMSDNKTDRAKVRTPFLQQLGRSKTINVPNVQDNEGKPKSEGPFSEKSSEDKLSSPVPQPTSSCLALKQAVSALTRIDDFILEELGSGFFANVYKATHRVTGEEMVMKINKDHANRSAALREVQLMNRLSHPNILRFLGVCVHEGQLHALTEYISGGTLEALLADKNEELPWMLRIKIAVDIIEGMHYLHSEGVFHRDLTSRNILIKKGENRNYQAVIADFGLATKIPDPNATEPLPPVGCPWWMAPEVINGKFYDERADLFSYGIILLEITARIEADPETMPRTKNFGVDYLKMCELVDYCPLDFLQLAFKCCQILPERRPSSGVIKITLETIYKNLQNDTMAGTEKLRKRSKSEDNLIQSSDSFTEIQGEVFLMNPQVVAQAMTKDDPDYCPANANPFANISKYKDGRKVHEFPKQRKGSGNNSGLGLSGKYLDLQTFQISECWVEKRESQSLPSSPIMLRKAAEKLHLASLLGSDAVRLNSQHDLRFSASNNNQNTEIITPVSRRAHFSSNRTRSLGSLDFWSPRHGPGAVRRCQGGRGQNYPNNSEKVEYCNRFQAGTRDFNFEDRLVSGISSCTDYRVDRETFHSVYGSNINCSLANNAHGGLNNEKSGRDHLVFHGSCQESRSPSSMSSLSCRDIAEEEEIIEIVSDSSVTLFQGEAQRKQPLTGTNNSNSHDLCKPQIAIECGSYDCSHFSVDINEDVTKMGSSKGT